MMVTSGAPDIIKYKPFTGWFAKAIGSTGPIKLDMTTLEFLNVPYRCLATACNTCFIGRVFQKHESKQRE